MFRINQATCSLCSSPYPYVCSGCRSTIEDAMKESEAAFQEASAKEHQQPKMFIGSGEDAMFIHQGAML